jgi:hypothetical protein
MEKPLSIKVSEIKEGIVNIINTSGLHPTILQPLVKEIYLEVDAYAKSYAAQEQKQYELYLANINKEQDKNNIEAEKES